LDSDELEDDLVALLDDLNAVLSAAGT